MQYDSHDRFLRAAFDVIRVYDPVTYEAMRAARWHVYTDDLLAEVSGGFGATTGPTNPETVLGPAVIREWAHGNHVHPKLFAADVLVHEFQHIHQPDDPDSPELEDPAFDAGTAFARKLPAPDGTTLARFSQATRAYVDAGGE